MRQHPHIAGQHQKTSKALIKEGPNPTDTKAPTNPPTGDHQDNYKEEGETKNKSTDPDEKIEL